MLNRRHIRLKIVQYLYALQASNFEDTKQQNNNLFKSLESVFNLFIFQISFLLEIQKIAKDKFLAIHSGLQYTLVNSLK